MKNYNIFKVILIKKYNKEIKDIYICDHSKKYK